MRREISVFTRLFISLAALLAALTISVSADICYGAATAELDEFTMKPELKGSSMSLMAEYLETQIQDASQDGAASGKKLRRDRLNDQEKTVYDLLKKRIGKLAAGTEERAIIDIPLSDLGIEQSYTAAELGMDSIFDENDASVVSERARQALNGKMEVGLMKILGAILGDFPYELYWYDKTTGIAFEPPKIIGVDNGEGGALVFDSASKLTFKMAVAAAYSKTGMVGTYYADTAKTGAASSTVERVKAIVEENKALSDIEKLEAYKDAVIERTDYNYQSVHDYELYGIYGDPWQVIYVFDNDPSTKVVCEGYSKAFQYLCDLTDFKDKSIACHSVSGEMLAENGAGGAHMWNIVHIGERNYMVDLTNNDTVTADPAERATTKNDELFLAGAAGSLEAGYYHIEWQSDDPDAPYYITYYYDEDTLRFYETDELAISDISYREYQEEQGKAPITVTVAIMGDSFHRDGDTHTLRAGNLEEWTEVSEVTVPEGSKVITAINKLMKEKGYSASLKSGTYIFRVTNGDDKDISEKENGIYSGWMYTLNGGHPELGITEQTVEDGDAIVLHYTDDYRLEDDDLDIGDATAVKDLIGSIPENPSISDKAGVLAAKEALNKLEKESELLSKLVTEAERAKLVAALERISELEEKARKESEAEREKALEERKRKAFTEIKDIVSAYSGVDKLDQVNKAALEGALKVNSASSIEEIESIVASIRKSVSALNGTPGKEEKTVQSEKASTVTVNAGSVNAKTVKSAITKVGGAEDSVTRIVLGKKVKKINKKAFAKYKNAKKLVVKTKKLKKKAVKASLKGSKIKTIQVKVGSKKVNKKYVKQYKKIFTKKVCGRKVKVK